MVTTKKYTATHLYVLELFLVQVLGEHKISSERCKFLNTIVWKMLLIIIMIISCGNVEIIKFLNWGFDSHCSVITTDDDLVIKYSLTIAFITSLIHRVQWTNHRHIEILLIQLFQKFDIILIFYLQNILRVHYLLH